MARPLKLDAKRKDALLEALRLGLPKKLAAARAGISYETFRRWYVRGVKERRGKFRALREEIDTAEDIGTAVLIAQMAKAGQQGDWRASEALARIRARFSGDAEMMRALDPRTHEKMIAAQLAAQVPAASPVGGGTVIVLQTNVARPERLTTLPPPLSVRAAQNGHPALDSPATDPPPAEPPEERDFGIS